MPDSVDTVSEIEERSGAGDERIVLLRKRISLCRKVLARLHDNYLAEMKDAQARKERAWKRRQVQSA